MDQPNKMWALSEARKMDLTRSISALARPAGEVHLGPTNYADAYKTDTLLPVGCSNKKKVVSEMREGSMALLV